MIRALVVSLVLAIPVAAQSPHGVGGSVLFSHSPLPPVAPFRWELCSDDACVSLTAPDVTKYHSALRHDVTPANAADFGVDWDAWSAAVVNPAYNRSVFSFGAETHTDEFENPWNDFHLELLRLSLSGFSNGLGARPSVGGTAMDFIQQIHGDFNYDGYVNTLDYVYWKDQLSKSGYISNSSRPDGLAVAADYDLWRSAFGRTDWDARAAVGLSSAAIPEPSTLILVAMLALMVSALGRNNARR